MHFKYSLDSANAFRPARLESFDEVIGFISLNGDLKIIFDCGEADFFADVNKELHEKLVAEGIPHEYTVRKGKHNWDYWRNSIKYHLLYFDDFFSRK